MDLEQMGKKLSEARKKKGYTQKQLADLLHVTDKAVSKWERGLGYPDITMLVDLTTYLDLDLYSLLGGEENMSKESVNKVLKSTILTLKKIPSKRWFQNLAVLGFSIVLLVEIVFLGLMLYSHYEYKFTISPSEVTVEAYPFSWESVNSTKTYTYKNSPAFGVQAFIQTLPMQYVLKNNHTIKIKEQAVFFEYSDSEDDINKDRNSKDYVKQSMIVDSVVLFLRIEDLEDIHFEFQNKLHYTFTREDVIDFVEAQGLEFKSLEDDDIFKKVIINYLNDITRFDTMYTMKMID